MSEGFRVLTTAPLARLDRRTAAAVLEEATGIAALMHSKTVLLRPGCTRSRVRVLRFYIPKEGVPRACREHGPDAVDEGEASNAHPSYPVFGDPDTRLPTGRQEPF